MTASISAMPATSVDARGATVGASLGAISVFMYFVALLASRFVLASADAHAFGEPFDGIFATTWLTLALAGELVLLVLLFAVSSFRSSHVTPGVTTCATLLVLMASLALQIQLWTQQHARTTILARETGGNTVFYDGVRTGPTSIVGYRIASTDVPSEFATVHRFSPRLARRGEQPQSLSIVGEVLSEVRYGSVKNNRLAWHTLASASGATIAAICALFLIRALFSRRHTSGSIASTMSRDSAFSSPTIIAIFATAFWLYSTLQIS